MRTFHIALLISSIILSQNPSHAAELNANEYILSHGWEIGESKQIAHSPDPDVLPIMYYEKGSASPSCGLITAGINAAKPNFIELLSAEPGATYPYCMNVVSMVAFQINNKKYISVEFVQRDTREEFYRHFSYLHHQPLKGYVIDESFNAVDADNPTDVSAATFNPSRALDGVTIARATYLTAAFPQWRFLRRHFISDRFSSFAVFEENKTQQCFAVVETGSAPVVFNYTEFSPGTTCIASLASARLNKADTTYYLAMFKSDKDKPVVAIISVTPNGNVGAERALSYTLNRSSMIKDIKSAKAALADALR